MNLHLFHQWTKWELTDNGTINETDTKKIIGKIIEQTRTCETCGKLEIIIQKIYI